MNELKHLIELYRENRYKIISERMIDVDNQTVMKQKYLTCSCENQSYTKQEGICRHKQFFIILPFLKLIETQATEILDYYKVAKTQSKNENEREIYNQIIDDLDKFVRIDFR